MITSTDLGLETEFANGKLSDFLYRIIREGTESKRKIFLCATGGGARVASFLSELPGSSKSFVGAHIPYHRGMSKLFVDGRDLGAAVSPYAASALANAAYLSAMEALLVSPSEEDEGSNILGIGATASIASDGRRGSDRIEIGVRTLPGFYSLSVEFEKSDGMEGRRWQQTACELLILNCILDICGVEQIKFDSSQLTGRVYDGQVRMERLKIPKVVSEAPTLVLEDGTIGSIDQIRPETHIIYPGSYATLHIGHDRAAHAAMEQTGKKVVFEIVGENADKDPVSFDELLGRTIQMRGRWPVIIRRDCGRFIDKCTAYNGADFVVGYDTAERLLDRKFHDDSPDKMRENLQAIQQSGSRIHVLGRVNKMTGRFETADDLVCENRFSSLFRPLAGRVDVSASKLIGVKS